MWWLALGWSLAEVAAGVAQGYETLALYRDVLVPESNARELVASALAPSTWPLPQPPPPPPATQNGGGSDNSPSPPRAADERLRESLSRGEDGGGGGGSGACAEVAGSPPVRGRQLQSASRSAWTAASDAEIRLEVDKDFDELVAVKAREELEELYGFPAIVSRRPDDPLSLSLTVLFFGGGMQRVPVFVSCLLRVASILLSLGIVLLLSAGYITSPLALSPIAENELTAIIPPCWSNGLFWGTFLGVCAVNWCLSLLHTPVFLPRVGVHVVAYLGLLVGLGMLFAGLGVWDALS